MSMKSNDRADHNSFTTSIKLEYASDDDTSSELNSRTDYYSNQLSTSAGVVASLSSAYKGKIEVTSKGRRKIFDGVRWQILCRRPECRKQTNKKSLCITHYKEEYESHARSSLLSSSWPNNPSPFQVPRTYQQRHSFDKSKSRHAIEDQNNTISTTNLSENNEQSSFSPHTARSIHEGQIEYMDNGRRFVFKNSKWQPLCKYDHICRNTAKYELLCIKHFELTQQKRRNIVKFHNHNKQRSHFNRFDKHQSRDANDTTKRLKTNGDFQISSSSLTEQFDINSNENIHTSAESVHGDASLLTSKLSDHEKTTSSKTLPNHILSKNLLKPQLTHDQSVQTDLTIPLCCIVHHDDHSFYSTCRNTTKSTSSNLSLCTKSEPHSFDTDFST